MAASSRDADMSADDLQALIDRHTALAAQEHPELGFEDALQAHEDRGALLALARRLEAALREMEPGKCPLCGDPECPAPVLEVLHGGE